MQTKTRTPDPWALAELDDSLDYRVWFRPSSRWERVIVRTIGKPETPSKTLEDGTTIIVHAELNVEHLGVTKVWEITSKLLLARLRQAVKALPCDIDVRCIGSPPRRTFEVRDHVDGKTDAEPDPAQRRVLVPHEHAWSPPRGDGA